VIRLVVADDHPVVCTGLLGILAADPELSVVRVAADGVAALEHVERALPDVAMLDLRMPGLDGIEVTRRIAARGLSTRVLVLTTYASMADVVAALDAGAFGYMLKDARPAELFAAIRSVAAGRRAVAPAAQDAVDAAKRSSARALSAREIQVLSLVARGESNKTLAAKLVISEATAKTHLLNIFEKLGVDDRTAAVTLAIQRGLLRLE
jgi:DNA-binding NarL/FixJ family response regulator